MPRQLWPLRHGSPVIELVLTLSPGGHTLPRRLLADTGAGTRRSAFELILEEDDCLLCGGVSRISIPLSGAFSGLFPTYDLRIKLPALGFDRDVRVVGVPSVPDGFDGIAGFRFLNRFTYGNFGDADQFGLEV